MAKLLGPRSGTASAGLTGEHKHRAFPSRLQSLRATTSSLEENMLPLLRYWLSSIVKKVLMLCRYRAVTTDFFSLEMECPLESAGSCCWPKQRPSLRSILLSFIGLWVKIWHRNKTACSELNPVQSSRSKSTSCPRNGHLLRFQSNSTATSDGGAQKIDNDVWHDSESITNKVSSKIGRKWNATCPRKGLLLRFQLNSTATSNWTAQRQKLWNDVWRDSESMTTKVYSQICRKWSAMFESHVVTSVDRTSFNFQFEDFFSYLTW